MRVSREEVQALVPTVLYAYVISPMSGPGHIIPSLQRSEEIRASNREKFIASYLLVDDRMKGTIDPKKPKGFRPDDTIEFVKWLDRIGMRTDTNLMAYGDGNLPGIARKLIEDFMFAESTLKSHSATEEDLAKLICEHSETMRTVLMPYVRFTDEKMGNRLGENQQCKNALFIAGGVGCFYNRLRDALSSEKPNQCSLKTYLPQDFVEIDFLLANGKFGNRPHVIFFDKAKKITAMKDLTIVSNKRTSAIKLSEADAVMLSTPKIFKRDFLGAITLAALGNPNIPIHLFGDDKEQYETTARIFFEKIPATATEIERLLRLRLSNIKWERFAENRDLNLNDTILKFYKRPAVISEGVGTMRTASDAAEHFMLQPCMHYIEPNQDNVPGVIAAFREIGEIGGAQAIINYRTAFRKFSESVNSENPNILQAIIELMQVHSANETTLHAADNAYCKSVTISEKSIGVSCYKEAEFFKSQLMAEKRSAPLSMLFLDQGIVPVTPISSPEKTLSQ
ncbi:MAG: hypothetical protein NTU49_03560 [Gammaproteobacteria bacterium]|nr:hypothetical protein [Gammaproteobacteria bacterium]